MKLGAERLQLGVTDLVTAGMLWRARRARVLLSVVCVRSCVVCGTLFFNHVAWSRGIGRLLRCITHTDLRLNRVCSRSHRRAPVAARSMILYAQKLKKARGTYEGDKPTKASN